MNNGTSPAAYRYYAKIATRGAWDTSNVAGSNGAALRPFAVRSGCANWLPRTDNGAMSWRGMVNTSRSGMIGPVTVWDDLTLEQYAVMINAVEEAYLNNVMDEYGMRLRWAKTGNCPWPKVPRPAERYRCP